MARAGKAWEVGAHQIKARKVPGVVKRCIDDLSGNAWSVPPRSDLPRLSGSRPSRTNRRRRRAVLQASTPEGRAASHPFPLSRLESGGARAGKPLRHQLGRHPTGVPVLATAEGARAQATPTDSTVGAHSLAQMQGSSFVLAVFGYCAVAAPACCPSTEDHRGHHDYPDHCCRSFETLPFAITEPSKSSSQQPQENPIRRSTGGMAFLTHWETRMSTGRVRHQGIQRLGVSLTQTSSTYARGESSRWWRKASDRAITPKLPLDFKFT